MLSLDIRQSLFVMVSTAGFCFFGAPIQIQAATVPATAPTVLYKAFGTFAQPPISGNDLFRLQGEPFSISVSASAALPPKHSGPGWAVYTPLVMTGEVKSGLLSAPTTINSHSASIELQSGPSGEIFTVASPVRVVGLQLIINAVVFLPPGTLSTLYIHPFVAPVALTPANATLSYSDGTETTVLGVNGTLTATQQAAAPIAALHTDERQIVAADWDGAQPMPPTHANRIDLNQPLDAVLRVYEAGTGGQAILG